MVIGFINISIFKLTCSICLSKSIQNNIRMRLYPKDFNWKWKSRWKDACPNISFSSNYKRIFLIKCKTQNQILIDHLGGTTALECKYINKYFIILASKDLFVLRQSAIEAHNMLQSVDVLHYDEYSLANTLEKMQSNVEEWWMDEKRQHVVSNFRNNYLGI